MAEHKKATADGLDGAKQQETRVIGRQCAADRAEGGNHNAAQQDFLAPELV